MTERMADRMTGRRGGGGRMTERVWDGMRRCGGRISEVGEGW